MSTILYTFKRGSTLTLHSLSYSITDINDFLTNSGWFTCLGKPLGSEALLHVLAKKCGMEYDTFMGIEKAVYMFAFGNEEKVYIGMLLENDLVYLHKFLF